MGSDAPRILLEELGLPYEFVAVGETDADLAAYRGINPTGKIPALILPDGLVMFESAAMLIHLTTVPAGSPLAPPPGTPEHARYLQWMVYLSANLYDAALRFYYAERFTAAGAAEAEGVKIQALADYERHAGLLERSLSPFLLGPRISAADIYLYMLAGWYPEGADRLRAEFPRLGALVAAVAARPATAKVLAVQG
jgi:glutathione S-transferase